MQGAALRRVNSSASDIARIPPSVARLRRGKIRSGSGQGGHPAITQKAELYPMRSHRKDRVVNDRLSCLLQVPVLSRCSSVVFVKTVLYLCGLSCCRCGFNTAEHAEVDVFAIYSDLSEPFRVALMPANAGDAALVAALFALVSAILFV